MKDNKKSARHYIAIVVGTLALSFANLYFLQTLRTFGSPLFFAGGVLLQILVTLVAVYSIVMALRIPLGVAGSIIVSAWNGIENNRYIKKLRLSESTSVIWLKRRFDRKRPTGLVLTLGVMVSLIWLQYFLSILHSVTSNGSLTAADIRIVNLLPSIRTHIQTQFFRFVTFWANSQTVTLVVIASVYILVKQKQRLVAALLVFAFGFEEVSGLIIKHLVNRPRPDQALWLIHEEPLSFPSGHMLRATVIFGLLAYLVFKSIKSKWSKLVVGLSYVIALFLIALSRIYLGVHFPTDVFGSFLLGASILTLLITAIEIMTRYGLFGQPSRILNNKVIYALPVAIIVWSLVASPSFVKIMASNSTIGFTTLPAVNTETVKQLPLYSETLTGGRMEPISFIYIGSQQQIESLFEQHGWYKADAPTFANTLRVYAAGLQNRNYLNAPVSPSYLNAKPEDLAFEKPTENNSIRQRHHTRLWETNFILPSGQHIWVATASFDEGIEITSKTLLPNHHIDPNIDAERAYILDSFGFTHINYLQVVSPQSGTNAGGDAFFTDGRAAIVQL